MKYIVRSIVAAGALAVAGGVSADFMPDLDPFIGADYYQVWMKGKNNYSQIFPKSFPGATIYVGTRFCESFGVELGWDWSAHKTKSWTLGSGTATFNGSVPAGTTITGSTKVRRNGGHIDLLGYVPLGDCFEAFGSIGYGWVQARISETNVAVSRAAGTSAANIALGNNIASAISSLSGKGRSVFRLGIGLNYMVTDCVGVRAKLGWETTTALRTNFNAAGTALGFSNKAWKDSGTLALGAFVKF